MGQEISHSQYPPDQNLVPGTYRISNLQAGTAIQVPDDDPTKVVTWEKHEGENQQWFLQRSGDGYQLQNRRHGLYLAVCNTDNHALVYPSKYPTTWVFLKLNENYIVQLADRNRVLDLHWGSAHNGNEVHIWNLNGNNMHCRVWTLERLGDDSGEGTASTQPTQEIGIAGAKPELTNQLNKGQEAADDEELSHLRNELSRAKQELSELHSLLYQRDETIQQLQRDLKSKEEALSHAYKANEDSAHLQSQHTLLESKFSRQQTETASLQAKVDRLEYLMSQVVNRPGGNVGTMGGS